MRRQEKVDILIIIGPDNPGEMTTQNFLQEKLKNRLKYFKDQGLSVTVIGNGKDPVSEDKLAKLPKAECVMLCGHGATHQKNNQTVPYKAHHITLSKQDSDTNELINSIQEQTGAKQFVIASCASGEVNANFQYGSHPLKQNTEVIALAPPNDNTSMYYALNSVLHAVNEIGGGKQNNNDINLSKVYADLLLTSPNAVSYGVKTRKDYVMHDFNPKDMMHFNATDPNSNFIDVSYQYNIADFRNFLEHNRLPALPSQSGNQLSASDQYKREYLDHMILLADVISVEKLIKSDPKMLKSATFDVYQYTHQMEGMRNWAKEDRMYIAMLKQLANYDMDHCGADKMRALFKDMKENRLSPVNASFLKCALFEIAIETKDDHKRSYLIQSLLYAQGCHLLEGVDPGRADALRAKLKPEMIEYIKQSAIQDACNYALFRMEQSPTLTLKDVQNELQQDLQKVSCFTNCDITKEMSKALYNNPKFNQLMIQGMQSNASKYQNTEFSDMKPNPLMSNNNNVKSSNSSGGILSKLGSKQVKNTASQEVSDDQLCGVTHAEIRRANPIAIIPPKAKEEIDNHKSNKDDGSDNVIRIKN